MSPKNSTPSICRAAQEMALFSQQGQIHNLALGPRPRTFLRYTTPARPVEAATASKGLLAEPMGFTAAQRGHIPEIRPLSCDSTASGKHDSIPTDSAQAQPHRAAARLRSCRRSFVKGAYATHVQGDRGLHPIAAGKSVKPGGSRRHVRGARDAAANPWKWKSSGRQPLHTMYAAREVWVKSLNSAYNSNIRRP